MATRTETDITLYTNEELQDIQDNSHSGSVTDLNGNIQAVLSAIITYTKTAAQANRDYVDILWSSIKTGSYTEKILGWIKMKPERTLDEHKYGIADTQWTVDIGSRITESGCKWIFVYNRDSEVPCGIRISWWKANNNETDPIDEAWANNPYIILPENRYAFPMATEVNTVVVQPAAIQVNKDFINTIFNTINYNIQTAAKNGETNVRIPWDTLGNSAEVQKMFVDTSKDVTIADLETSSSLSSCFNYGTLSGGHYTKTANRVFTVDDFDPLEMGFFNDATYLEDNYTSFTPTTNFTLYQILTEVLGYGVSYSASVDSQAAGQAFCIGLLITWHKENPVATNIENANNLADQIYDTESQQYNNSLTSVLSWPDDTIPTLESYIAANKKNNTSWLKTLVDLTASKMNSAFAKGDRAISILWSEVSSSYADEVKRAWQNSACEYNSEIHAAVPNGTNVNNNSKASLGSAYNTIMNAGYYSAGLTNPPTYSYGYIRYKKDGDTSGSGTSSSTTIEDIGYSESIGLAITLYGYVASSPQLGSTADAQTADAIRDIQYTWMATEAPKAK